MRTVWLGLIAMLLLLSFGCTPSGFVIGGKKMRHPVRKVVSLSPSTTEVIGSIEMAQYLIGRTSSCDYPPDIKSAVVVVSGTKPDFEKIARMKPDLIVYDAKLYANADLSQLQALGANLMPMNVDTVDQLIDYIVSIGSSTDMAMKASKVGDDIYAAVQNAKAVAPPKKVRVAFMTGGSGDNLVAGKDSFSADVIRICGGEPVGPPGKIFAPMSAESLVVANPEIILTSEDVRPILSDPRLASLAAVRAKPQPMVFHVDPGILLRSGPRVKNLIEGLSNIVGKAARADQGAQG